MAVVWVPFQCRCCGSHLLNHRDRIVLTSAATHTKYLLKLLGQEWAYLASTDLGKKGLNKSYIRQWCNLAMDKVVKLQNKLEGLNVNIKGAE